MNGTEPNGKARLNLYVSRWLVDLGRAHGLNLSRTMELALRAELSVGPDLASRIKELDKERELLMAQYNVETQRRFELDRCRNLAGARLQNWDKPNAAFIGWWSSPMVRRDFPLLAALEPAELWNELRELAFKGAAP